ncbi:MAG: marine proteobacterial sortase target protein [Desulfobulbaceae bacterium]|nr:marine proteobacterial sortase target protein [Desulfobulbaceae bacterium]
MMQESNAGGECKKQRSVDPGNLLIFVYVTVMVCLFLLGSVLQIDAASLEVDRELSPEEVQRGELLVIHDDGSFVPSPLLSQKVHIEVSGITARVKVEQHFTNAGEDWIEALYVFPLPDESGVDHLRLKVGGKVIVGMIQEKEKARATYEQAKKEGRKSSLLVQKRPNIFSSRVANIGPGESVVVEIEYQQSVAFDSGIFSLRFPMVVAPRYIPGKPLRPLGIEGAPIVMNSSGWGLNTDQVPDGSEITPSVDVNGEFPIPVQLAIDLAAGMPLLRVDSLYHGLEKEKLGDGHYRLRLSGEVVADRDFVLEWQPKKEAVPNAALFAENRDGNQYMLMMLMPPQIKAQKPLARELVFILDISGSMAGASIVQAKAAITLALERMLPQDKFNVIAFNNSSHPLFGVAQTADQHNIAQAQQFVAGLQANGGTEMQPALKLALDGSSHHERLRQVLFLTDGAVGNEAELLALITRRLGDSRLFTVGIGSAPNSYFMSRAATLGRGTYTYIGKGSEVQSKMMEVFGKIENPVLSDLAITVNGSEVEMEAYPSPLPDLYLGEPLIVALRSGWENSTLQVSGNLAGRPWQASVDTSTYGERAGIGALWGRKKIRSLMESQALGADKESVRKEVVATALSHHLVSKYTSLVAVDDSVSRPQERIAKSAMVKTHLPNGWQKNAVFAGGSQTGTSSSLKIVLGVFLLLLASLAGRKRMLW